MTQTPQTNQSTEHLNLGKLNAFIDSELPPAERQGIEQHLTGCHACTMRILSATQLKTATCRAGHRFAPSPEALMRLTAELHSQAQKEARTKKTARIHSMTTLRSLAWAALAARPSC
jgi:anti-sigma factor RsiW